MEHIQECKECNNDKELKNDKNIKEKDITNVISKRKVIIPMMNCLMKRLTNM